MDAVVSASPHATVNCINACACRLKPARTECICICIPLGTGIYGVKGSWSACPCHSASHSRCACWVHAGLVRNAVLTLAGRSDTHGCLSHT